MAAKAGEINSETQFVLNFFHLESPRDIEDVVQYGRSVCLVDHNEASQMHPSIHPDQVRYIIDHHGLMRPVTPSEPIHIQIHPVGSTATILAYRYFSSSRVPSRAVAGCLLCAVLSDTVHLRSPTTTQSDKEMVQRLAVIAKIRDVSKLANKMFEAKSDISNLSAEQLLKRDYKEFVFLNGQQEQITVAFAVIETVRIQPLINRKDELLQVMSHYQDQHKKIDHIFLALVDLSNLQSYLLTPSSASSDIARQVYKSQSIQGVLMSLGNRVSRKKEFIPPLLNYFASV
eukprot:GILK01013104.1.p1 GENE.GILK01013104.1~~GILK01013104.1.p1  ORF type:complete len:336 (+),score=75.52 GILK01013104.1:148-1008(+)